MIDKDRVIMANARRLIKKSTMLNWVLYSELFGVGSTTARNRCAEIGLNPDSKTFFLSGKVDNNQ